MTHARSMRWVAGALALATGAESEGRSMLVRSMEMYPSLDALAELAPLYRRDGEQDQLSEACRETRQVAREDVVLSILKVCHIQFKCAYCRH